MSCYCSRSTPSKPHPGVLACLCALTALQLRLLAQPHGSRLRPQADAAGHAAALSGHGLQGCQGMPGQGPGIREGCVLGRKACRGVEMASEGKGGGPGSGGVRAVGKDGSWCSACVK